MLYLLFFFFFKQKTAYEMRISDWSSDVCSSDLIEFGIGQGRESLERLAGCGVHGLIDHGLHLNLAVAVARGDGPSAPAPRETTSSDQSCVRPDALFSAIQRFSSSVPSRGGK